jgi:hypothetical protein
MATAFIQANPALLVFDAQSLERPLNRSGAFLIAISLTFPAIG